MKALSGFLLLCGASVDAADAPDLMIRTNENPSLRVDAIVVEALLCRTLGRAEGCDRPVKVTSRRVGDTLRVPAKGTALNASATVPLSELPKLDLQSASVSGHYQPAGHVLVEITYGDRSDCFANDDGRSQLTIALDASAPAEIHTTRIEQCAVKQYSLVGGKWSAEPQ